MQAGSWQSSRTCSSAGVGSAFSRFTTTSPPRNVARKASPKWPPPILPSMRSSAASIWPLGSDGVGDCGEGNSFVGDGVGELGSAAWPASSWSRCLAKMA